MVIETTFVDVPVGEERMRSALLRPRTAGTYPGVVFYSDIFQLTGPTLRWAARLAGYGFVVLVPEIYHRVEAPGTVLGFDDEGKARGQADVEALTAAQFDEDVRAALDFLHADPGVGRLGAAGHCTGGHIGYRAAFQADVAATALWYPTGLHDGKLGADADAGTLALTPAIAGELLLVFGADDPHTPAAGRDVVRAALVAAGVAFRWSVYDAEHAFGRDVGPRFDPVATDLAFAETVALLSSLR
jgi:carboxymethylenebutenolidase